MSLPADLEAAAATLYAGTREGFVAARNALAKQVKAAGQAALAAGIATLPKPAATAWAIDRVWWEAPECIRALFVAAGELRSSLSAGGGTHGADSVRARHRAALVVATNRAAAQLPSVSVATRRRLTTTLEALAAMGRWPFPGPGCLAADLDPPGFEALGAMPTLERAPDDEAVQSANDDAAAVDAATAALRIAEARLQVCREHHDALVAAHRDAQAATEQAASALARAQAHHARCIDAELATSRDLGQRRAELDAARTDHAAARSALDALDRTR